MKLSTLALTASLAAMALPASANATAYLITYTGTVSSGYDTTGVFAAPNTLLAGAAFTAVYTLTYPTPGAVESSIADVWRIYSGGTTSGTTSPLSGMITINGNSRAISGNYYGQASYQNEANGSDDRVYHSVQEWSDYGTFRTDRALNSLISSTVNDIVATTDFTAPLDYTLNPGDSSFGAFGFYSYDYRTNQYFENVYGNLVPTRVMIAMVNSIPAPATWALMIAGLGLIGGAMRRRKAAVSFA